MSSVTFRTPRNLSRNSLTPFHVERERRLLGVHRNRPRLIEAQSGCQRGRAHMRTADLTRVKKHERKPHWTVALAVAGAIFLVPIRDHRLIGLGSALGSVDVSAGHD